MRTSPRRGRGSRGSHRLGACSLPVDGSHLELDPVNDPHLLEECRLAALARAEQQQLHLPAKRLPVLLQHPVDLLALVALLDLLGAEFEAQATRPR